jgi:uncharacterized protein (TIGR03085 family)
MPTPARLERHRFADELLAAGPDAPTLCEGWTTRDLAAHVIARERRPDAMPGVLISALSGHTGRVRDKIASREWNDIVELIRSGPPVWSPTRINRVDRLVNTTEFFVHLEDVRRADGAWEVRELDDDLAEDLAAALGRIAKMLARKAPAGISLEPDGGRHRITARDAEPMVIVRGPTGELVLWMFGRQDHARVEYEGDADAIEALGSASFGI